MKPSERKRKLVEELANLHEALNVQQLYCWPNHKTTKDWLANVAAVLKNLDETDYQDFIHLSKIVSTGEREERKEAAHTIDNFVRRKVAEYKRYDFSDLDKQETTIEKQTNNYKNKNENKVIKLFKKNLEKYWIYAVLLIVIVTVLSLFGYLPTKWTIKLPFLEAEFLRQNLPNGSQAVLTPTTIARSLDSVPSTITSANLRVLEPLETGKNIDKLPDNTYGFADVIDTAAYIKNPKIFSLTLSNSSYKNFEIQKINSTNFLVGFVGNESFSKIGETNESRPINLTLFPSPWENMSYLVAIPFDSISDIAYRRIDLQDNLSVGALDLTTIRFETGAVSHIKR